MLVAAVAVAEFNLQARRQRFNDPFSVARPLLTALIGLNDPLAHEPTGNHLRGVDATRDGGACRFRNLANAPVQRGIR